MNGVNIKHDHQDIFYNREHQQALGTSYFMSDPSCAEVPLRLLTEAQLAHYDERKSLFIIKLLVQKKGGVLVLKLLSSEGSVGVRRSLAVKGGGGVTLVGRK